MKILVACEFTGEVRDAFIAKGHNAMSCDLLPSIRPGPHYQGDVRDVLYDGWDALIAFPPCTYLTNSGMGWNAEKPYRLAEAEKSLEFVKLLWDADIDHTVIENPVGLLSTRFMKPSQIIQPWQFGAVPVRKTTCLWLRNLPPLKPVVTRKPDKFVELTAKVTGVSGTRAMIRSATLPQVAEQMALQWGTGKAMWVMGAMLEEYRVRNPRKTN